MEKGTRPDDCRGRWNSETLFHHFEQMIALLKEHYDTRFSEVKDATDKALAAVKEQTAAAFAANKESVLKTEDAQREYNAQHNDLTRKMEAQASKFIDEKQFNLAMEAIKADIGRLQQGSAAGTGRRETQQEHRQTAQWGLGQVIATIGVLTAILVALIELLRNKP